MRRIHACVLVLGITGICGFGVMRGIAQTDGPALQPDQLKPANYLYPKNPGTPLGGDNGPRPEPMVLAPAPAIIDPLEPSSPDALPALVPAKPEPMPAATPPSDPQPQPNKPAPLSVPAPDVPQPPSKGEPDVAPVKQDNPPVAPPKVEMAVPPASPPEFGDPKKEPAPLQPNVPFTNPGHTAADPVRPAAPPASSGNRILPSLSIETIAPDMVPFGQPVTYEIVVKNLGQIPVAYVRVDEELGQGTKFVSSEPAGDISSGDKGLWMLGTLNAGEEKRIKISVKPGNEGDLSTKPRVTYSATTTTNVRITRPNLVVNVQAPEAVQVGEELPVQIQISNNGTGDATKVVLKALLSDGLKHPEGNDIQAVLNKLAPGESQALTLRIQAAQPGSQGCTLSATTEGAAKAAAQTKFDVRQPKLNLAVSGPVKCVVRAEPVFTVEVSNPGTSPTEPVQVAAAFPDGLDFVSASDGGAYDTNTRTVSWNLVAAAAGSKRNLTVKTKSSAAGNLAVRAVAQAGSRLNARAEAVIQSEGVPALLFEVVDLEDPIEVGKETTYEIRISNTGSIHCTNVRLSAAMSDGLIAGAITSNVPHKIQGQTLVFDPIAKLPVKAELVIRVKAKGTTPGDHRFKVQLACDQLKQPVVKEESTSFFQQ